MYKTFFPQLVAGPIVRYRDIVSQVDTRSLLPGKITLGIKRFIIGLGKKVLIADTVARVADMAFGMASADRSPVVAWLGVLCYALQIYFDFSGYSDMAIGMGKMFGFDFLENFDHPYSARSIKEFWRRWHISLSSWFRDYIYIPLGGNRKGVRRNYSNLMIVFLLCGFWHGASWTFIAWGLWHGLFLVIERTRWGEWLGKSPRIIQYLYTIVVVLIGWVFFRSTSMSHAFSYLQSLIIPAPTAHGLEELLNTKTTTIICLGIVACTPLAANIHKLLVCRVNTSSRTRLLYNLLAGAGLFGIFILSVASLAANTSNPFIYFRF